MTRAEIVRRGAVILQSAAIVAAAVWLSGIFSPGIVYLGACMLACGGLIWAVADVGRTRRREERELMSAQLEALPVITMDVIRANKELRETIRDAREELREAGQAEPWRRTPLEKVSACSCPCHRSYLAAAAGGLPSGVATDWPLLSDPVAAALACPKCQPIHIEVFRRD